jgi:hypothetical protein
VAKIRQKGMYEGGRSDIVRAGVHLLKTLPVEDKLKAVRAVDDLKSLRPYLACVSLFQTSRTHCPKMT